jgi:ubiquinone/menaquinone biosynthesis C-methylase UbiE
MTDTRPGNPTMRSADATAHEPADDPLTERLLTDAGVGPGMRVLDLGTGAGDVALLAARIVGPSGRVVSVDRDLRTLMLAAVRCERAEVEHVDLAVGDLAVPDLPEGGFDAVVARSVLLDLPDPARTLRAAAARLRPGGVVCVQETGDGAQKTVPRLRRTFAAAGLATPAVRDAAAGGAGPAVAAWARVAAA